MSGLGLDVGDADVFLAQLPIRKFTTTLENSNEFRDNECGDTSTASPRASTASVNGSRVVQIECGESDPPEASKQESTPGERLLAAQEMIVGQTSSREATSGQVPLSNCKTYVSKCEAPACELPRITPRPTSSEGVRRSPHDRAITMAPMMRARHMDILDLQYAHKHSTHMDARSAPGKRISNVTTRRSTCSYGRAQSARGQVAPKSKGCDIARGSGRRAPSSRGRLASKSVACEKENTPGGRNSGPRQTCIGFKDAIEDEVQQEAMGPKGVMPLLRGQVKVQAEAARCVVDKVAREARLKDQFKVQPPSCPRSKTRGRSDEHMLQRFR